MYKKIMLVLMITIISFNTTFINANAASNLSHSEMSDIYGSGYTNALLETVVEVNAKASTRLEENRNLLTQYYDDTKGYINQRIQDYGKVDDFGDLLIEQASGAMTLADGVLDLITNLFGEKEGTKPPDVAETCKPIIVNQGSDEWNVKTNCGFEIISYLPEQQRNFHGLIASYKWFLGGYVMTIASGPYYLSSDHQYYGGSSNKSTSFDSVPLTYARLDTLLRKFYKNKAYLVLDGKPVFETIYDIKPTFYKNTFNNYKSNPTTRQPVYIPQLQPKLSCPDGDKVVQIDGRGGFVHANGVPVNSDGCTVYWQKPSVTVDDEGKVKLTDPVTGETTDIDIKPPKDKIPVEDKGEGCDGVLCFLGAVTSGIADLISTILGLVGDILDGLFELVKKIFLPSETFWSSNMDGLKNKFFHKEIKEVQNGIESLETVGGGQFGDVTGSLMGVDNLKIIDSSSINMSLDTLHSWVRGFFYPLLLFFNINQMYRVIRGTSLIGIGGKKEE